MAYGAFILWNDVIAGAGGSTAALSHTGAGSSVGSATLPLANAIDSRVAKVARITRAGCALTTSETLVTFTVSPSLPAGAAGVCGIRWTVASGTVGDFQFKVRLESSAAFVFYDSGWITTAAVIPNRQGSPTSYYADLAFFGDNSSFTVDTAKVYVHFRVTGGTADGVLDIGRVFASDFMFFQNGMDADVTVSASDPSRVMRSRGGQLYTEQLPIARTMSLKLSLVPEGVAINNATAALSASLRRLCIEAGQSRHVIVVPRINDAWIKGNLGIYGRLTKPPVIVHQGGGNYATQFDIEQAL